MDRLARLDARLSFLENKKATIDPRWIIIIIILVLLYLLLRAKGIL